MLPEPPRSRATRAQPAGGEGNSHGGLLVNGTGGSTWAAPVLGLACQLGPAVTGGTPNLTLSAYGRSLDREAPRTWAGELMSILLRPTDTSRLPAMRPSRPAPRFSSGHDVRRRAGRRGRSRTSLNLAGVIIAAWPGTSSAVTSPGPRAVTVARPHRRRRGRPPADPRGLSSTGPARGSTAPRTRAAPTSAVPRRSSAPSSRCPPCIARMNPARFGISTTLGCIPWTAALAFAA